MHVGCLGVIKRMLELTFLVGEKRTRVTSRRLSPPSMFNDLMKVIKVVREFSRRVRDLDFAVLKAQELRNIVLFFFPIVIQCIEPTAKERRVWFLLAFMFRACVVPCEEYENVKKEEILNASKHFYSLFQQLFSTKNCTYSVHMIGGHILDMRSKDPLTHNSAFNFESFYGEMRKCFSPGTTSTLKQIMKKIYLKRSLSFHCCEKTIFYSNKNTGLEDNSLVYIFVDKKHTMYKIIDIDENDKDLLYCNVQGIIPIDFEEAKDLDWSTVGVYREGATGNDVIELNRNNVHGKVIKISSLLITIPKNILHEQ